MIDPSQPSEAAILAEFLARYVEDDSEGGVRPLADYLARFPGYEEIIAREFAEMEERRESREARREASDGERTIAHFRIRRTIGRGGQGEVYLARDTRLERDVALKVVRGWEREQLLRFRREAGATARLSHPGIAAIYEVGEADGLHFIAMRYVKGCSLQDALAEARDTDGEIDDPVGLIEKLARALHAAHEAGLVHRDVKPGNVIVTEEGDPVLLDFGLVLDETSDTGDLTVPGQMTGTPAYLAPEQVAAQRIPVDRRADVYALGVTLYECLTLRRPFEAPTREQLYHQILVAPPPDPRRVNPAITRDMRAVLETALEKDRDRRYQTALAFAEDLARLRRFEPVHARPAGPWLRLKRWTRRNRGVAAALAGVIAALTVGLVVSLALLAESDRARARAETDFRTAMDAVESMLVEVGLSEESLASQPDLDATRRRLLERAIAFYERLLLTHRDDPRVRRETVVTRSQLAFLNRWVGRFDVAEREARAAEKACRRLLAERPDADSLRVDLSRALRVRGKIALSTGRGPEAEACLQEAIRELRGVRRTGRAAIDDRFRLAGLLGDLSRLRHTQDDLPRADAAIAEAIQLLESLRAELPANDKIHARLASAKRQQALVLLDRDRLDAAHAALTAALAGFKRLMAKFPDVSSHAINRALTLCALGDVETRRGRRRSAGPLLAEAVVALSGLTDRHPDSESLRQQLANARIFHAEFLISERKPVAAEAELLPAREAVESFLRAHPDSAEHRRRWLKIRRSLAWCARARGRASEAKREEEAWFEEVRAVGRETDHEQLKLFCARIWAQIGYTRARRGAVEEADALIREAIEALEALVERHPGRPAYRAEWAEALNKQATVHANTGRLESADRLHRRVIEIRRALVKTAPENARYLSQLGGSLSNHAFVLGRLGEFEENLASLEEAIELQRKALRLNPASHTARRFLPRHYWFYGATLVRLGRIEDAARSAHTVRSELPEEAEAWFTAAHTLALCAAAPGADPGDRERFAARAMKSLEKAVALGFTDPARVRRDPGFGILEEREGFRDLVGKMRRK